MAFSARCKSCQWCVRTALVRVIGVGVEFVGNTAAENAMRVITIF